MILRPTHDHALGDLRLRLLEERQRPRVGGTQQRAERDLRVITKPPEALVDDGHVRVVDAQDRDRIPIQIIPHHRLSGRDHLRGHPLGERTEIPYPAPRRLDRVLVLR